MSHSADEQKFTTLVQAHIEPELHYEPDGIVADAECTVIARCYGSGKVSMAEIVCKLLNWALDNYPFVHPEDATIVRKGLDGPLIETEP